MSTVPPAYTIIPLRLNGHYNNCKTKCKALQHIVFDDGWVNA